MPRFYLRKLRAELGAHGETADVSTNGVAVLERGLPPAEPGLEAGPLIIDTEAAAAGPAVAEAPAPKRRRPRARAAEVEALADEVAIEAVMTEPVAEVAGVTPEGDALAALAADTAVGAEPEMAGDTEALTDADLTEVDASEMETADDAMPGHRRRRRRRRGQGRQGAETLAAEEGGELPGEPALPPQTVYDEGYVPELPPSAHLSAMVQSGGLVLPEPRGRRRRRGRGGWEDRAPEGNGRAAGPADGALTELEPVAHTPLPAAPSRGGRERSVLEDLIARQNVLLDDLNRRQLQMTKAFERMAILMERRGGGGGGGFTTANPRVGVFVDVPNIVYAADKMALAVDWGKALHYLTRDRQLVRATAYSPISDDPYQRVEMQRFVQPFYHLPYRIMTKAMKRFGNGEIKANFDVELAIDIVTMADRLDIVSLVSGDGDFRRMVELVQSKGVRVEVVAFGSSTAGELRAVADDYIDISQHQHDFCVTK